MISAIRITAIAEQGTQSWPDLFIRDALLRCVAAGQKGYWIND